MWMPIMLVLYGSAVALPTLEQCAAVLEKGRKNEMLTGEEIEILSRCKPYSGLPGDGDYAVPAQRDNNLDGVPQWQ